MIWLTYKSYRSHRYSLWLHTHHSWIYGEKTWQSMFEVCKNYPTIEKKSDVKLISLIVASGGSELEHRVQPPPVLNILKNHSGTLTLLPLCLSLTLIDNITYENFTYMKCLYVSKYSKYCLYVCIRLCLGLSCSVEEKKHSYVYISQEFTFLFSVFVWPSSFSLFYPYTFAPSAPETQVQKVQVELYPYKMGHPFRKAK